MNRETPHRSVAFESTRTIEIDEFVDRSEIDPRYLIRPYYLVPDGKVGHEETGYHPDGDFLPLGEARQPGGKVVRAWAIEGDWDPALIQSNTFETEWPPRSGRRLTFPEIDRAAWFGIAARRKILKGQMIFVDRLLESSMSVCRDNR
jgi:predicted NUDIX family NTP pyrophosphohydrolase